MIVGMARHLHFFSAICATYQTAWMCSLVYMDSKDNELVRAQAQK